MGSLPSGSWSAQNDGEPGPETGEGRTARLGHRFLQLSPVVTPERCGLQAPSALVLVTAASLHPCRPRGGYSAPLFLAGGAGLCLGLPDTLVLTLSSDHPI